MKTIVLSEHAMKDLNDIYHILHNVKNGVTITDEQSKILYTNPAFSTITGYSKSEALGENPGILHSGYHDEKFYKKMWDDIKANGFWEGEIWNRHKSGKIYPSLLTISAISSPGSKGIIYIAVFSDITFLEEDSAEKMNLAFYDPLTRLPNRLALKEHFTRVISLYNRKHHDDPKEATKPERIIFLFFDLNKFKLVNDNYGHLVGDKLLKEIGRRLQEAIRGTDIMARFGGDEFVGIIPEMKDKSSIKDYCTRLQKILSSPFEIDGHELNTSASIGISICPDNGEEFDELVNQADKAMYHAKKNQVPFAFCDELT